MKQIEVSGSVEEYAGNKLPAPIEFKSTADQYDNVTEAKASEDWPGESEILKLVNRSKLTSAKASAYQKATKELKDAYEKTPEYARKVLVSALVTSGKNPKEAEALADSLMAS